MNVKQFTCTVEERRKRAGPFNNIYLNSGSNALQRNDLLSVIAPHVVHIDKL